MTSLHCMANYYHTKYRWISNFFAIWLNSTAFQNSPKMQMPSTLCNFCKPSILVCFSKPLPDRWLLAFPYRLDLAEFAESPNLAKMLMETNFYHLQKNLQIKWNVLPLCTPALSMGSCIYPQTGSGGSLGWKNSAKKCRSRQFSPGMRILTSQMCWSVSQKSWLTFSLGSIHIEQVCMASFFGNVRTLQMSET